MHVVGAEIWNKYFNDWFRHLAEIISCYQLKTLFHPLVRKQHIHVPLLHE